MPVLYVAFKGNGNSSNKIVRKLNGDKLFLTNSYGGLKNDIDNINCTYDLVYMFGLDKNLKGNIRIDCVAQRDQVYLYSTVNVDSIAMKLNQNGIITNILEAKSTVFPILKQTKCRSSKEVNGSPTLFSAS